MSLLAAASACHATLRGICRQTLQPTPPALQPFYALFERRLWCTSPLHAALASGTPFLGMSQRAIAPAAAASFLRRMRYEIIPLNSASDCIRFLPPASVVSVTCSPSRGISATQKLCESLLSLGHTPVPHLAARCVDGPAHATQLALWVRSCRLKEVFVVGGDTPLPPSYTHALPFMSDFL
jgi:hypothetical protein